MTEPTKSEYAVVSDKFPQPAVVAETQVYADERSVTIRYRTPENETALVRFPLCEYVIFGAPNDEALGGHPLSKHGLTFYTVHEIHNSSLIEMLERRNSVHSKHSREAFLKDIKHYVFTFQDSTLECVVYEGEWWKPSINIYNSKEDADRAWRSEQP